MNERLRHTLQSTRDVIATAAPFILVAFVLLAIAYWALDPSPPRRVVLATGSELGAYSEFGKRYAQILKGYGVTVELRNTQGAAENLRLLRDPNSGVDIAFMQGGADERLRQPSNDEDDDDPLVSLGSLFYEPVWIFYRTDVAQRRLNTPALSAVAQMAGWRINIGPPGSGVPNLVAKLIDANNLAPDAITLLRKPQTPAVIDLLAGDLDALVFAAAPESLMVQMLLQTPGIGLFSFGQAEAYSRRLSYLTPVTLPRGVVDLARDLPQQDVHLVAPTATLVARSSMHPALVQLFVQAAHQIHGGAGWFQRKGDFPNATSPEHPLSKEAERYYTRGVPLLQRYLPFWLANLIERMWPVLVGIAAVLIPLSGTLPKAYEFRVRSRIYRWYARLRAVDAAVGKRPADELLRELNDIESRVADVTVPLAYADELYALRRNIQMIGDRLRDVTPGAGQAPLPS